MKYPIHISSYSERSEYNICTKLQKERENIKNFQEIQKTADWITKHILENLEEQGKL